MTIGNELTWYLIENFEIAQLHAWAKEDRGVYKVAAKVAALGYFDEYDRPTISQLGDALDWIEGHIIPTVVRNNFEENSRLGG